jgi:hypothetical protein
MSRATVLVIQGYISTLHTVEYLSSAAADCQIFVPQYKLANHLGNIP